MRDVYYLPENNGVMHGAWASMGRNIFYKYSLYRVNHSDRVFLVNIIVIRRVKVSK